MTHCQETKESPESESDIMQMLEISERGIKILKYITIINMLNTPMDKFGIVCKNRCALSAEWWNCKTESNRNVGY